MGVKFETREYEGVDPAGFVVSLNLHRRHPTESQRAAVAAKLANIARADAGRMGAEAQGKAAANLPEPPVSQAQAADMLNVSERSVRAAAKVLRDGDESLVKAVESGEVAVNTAAVVSNLPKDEQRTYD